jgi:hypothetical protein
MGAADPRWTVTVTGTATPALSRVSVFDKIKQKYFVRADLDEQQKLVSAHASKGRLQRAEQLSQAARVSFYDRSIMVHLLLAEAYHYNFRCDGGGAPSVARQRLWAHIHAAAMHEMLASGTHTGVVARLSSMGMFHRGKKVRAYEYDTRAAHDRRRRQLAVIAHLDRNDELFLSPPNMK